MLTISGCEPTLLKVSDKLSLRYVKLGGGPALVLLHTSEPCTPEKGRAAGLGLLAQHGIEAGAVKVPAVAVRVEDKIRAVCF